MSKISVVEGNNCLEENRYGLVAETPNLVIRDDKGNIVWDAESYSRLLNSSRDAPPTVNPALWRHQRLECVSGLFKVADGVWQIRGYDVSNLTIIRSDHGYILVDAMHSPYTASAAIEFAFSHLPEAPIYGLIITHSHGDHFGGYEGLFSKIKLGPDNIPIIAPVGFTKNAILENVFVGRAMKRRSPYQFGFKLPISDTGCVGAGLGIGCAKTGVSFIRPNKEISFTGEKLDIDGVKFIFQLTPDAEAPSELCFYLPDYKILCMTELLNPLQHNLLPLRGAQVRSAQKWAYYLLEASALFGDKAEAVITGHGWPVWGKRSIQLYLRKQRNLYKFIHDQTARLINRGMTMTEIAENLHLPASLNEYACCHGFYGNLKHNIKAVYQFYMGFYDGNPANLDPLPPEEAGRRYVEFMGGEKETLRKAAESYAKGDYRWAATVLNHLVFGFSDNKEARELLAKVLTQLGYKCECAPWRNAYLTGALELRQGPGPENFQSHMDKTTIANMPTGFVLDYLAAKIDMGKASDEDVIIALNFSDKNENWTWIFEDGVLNAWPDSLGEIQARYTLSRETFDGLACQDMTVAGAIAGGLIEEAGKKGQMEKIFSFFEETPNFNFGIVTP